MSLRIRSACCAPVLVGVITLSSFSSSLIHALGVGASYVLGMVTPLYLASSFIHKQNLLERPFIKRKLTELVFGKKKYPIFVSNVVAAFIFLITGAIMLVLTLTGKLGMTVAQSSITKSINDVAFKVTELTNVIPIVNIIFALIGIYLLYLFFKKMFKKLK